MDIMIYHTHRYTDTRKHRYDDKHAHLYTGVNASTVADSIVILRTEMRFLRSHNQHNLNTKLHGFFVDEYSGRVKCYCGSLQWAWVYVEEAPQRQEQITKGHCWHVVGLAGKKENLKHYAINEYGCYLCYAACIVNA